MLKNNAIYADVKNIMVFTDRFIFGRDFNVSIIAIL
tara:strand:- start:14961 stop:15068 length:108 start_codon:yes stop_codon:yes gene_type:complete